uniref:Nuclear pore complex protein nup214 n=1 Tax=Echinococcus granulosus TaxID=6210 RepID=A0A068X1G6_ECHGR|nr:nuclear pore complex protein nup214 [Echinococcus granulosus]
MDQLSTEELHHIPFEINELQAESNLLSASPNGLVFVARKNDLAVFSGNDYHQASSSFSQRKDKPLTTFHPNLCISLSRRVTWLSVNCSGSLLLLAYGSSIQLLNIQLLSAQSPHGLLGDTLDIPNAEGTIRDMAWNPADKHRFALVTTAGSVRMFSVNPLQKPHINSVGCLPASVNARCLSWSPKGKQLALTLTGTLSESTAAAAATNSTSIVQVDHDLKVKRVIPIDALLKEHLEDLTEPRPIDILWTSSYCFLLGVTDAASAKEMRLVFITVLVTPKSEPRLGKLPEFTSFGGGLCRYLMCLVPNSTTLATVTWLPDAEECYLLDVPSITASNGSPPADSLPKLIKPLPLPTDSYPIAMHVGALLDSPDPLPLIIGLLANGAVFAFKILPARISQAEGSCNVFAGFRMWCGSADKPPQLPSVATQSSSSPSASSEPSTTVATTLFGSTSMSTDGAVAPSGFAGLFNKSTTSDGTVAKTTSVVATKSGATTTNSATLFPATAFGSLFGKAATTASSTPTVATDSSVVSWFEKPATSTPSGFINKTSPKTPSGKPAATGNPSATSTVTTAATRGVKPTNTAVANHPPLDTGENPTAEPSAPTQSIMEAANHFWKALRSQAETSARAWSHLQSVFEGNSLNLQQKGDEVGVRRGVWDIEQSLNNMDDFLCVVEEITTELRKASQLSVNEQAASADYLDRLSADFDAFRHRISDKHRVIVAAGLDPGAAATLASLRRKSRAAESFLAELEDQVESLSAQLDARNERNNRLMSGSKLSLPMGDVGSPLDKIQATIATNARLIKCERYRLELIARMAGISLSDCLANKWRNTSTLAPSLGGSAISVDREQKDARLYRLLCGGDRCKTKTRTGKSTGPERLPVAKAPSTVAEVVELMRKEREKEDAQPPKSTPKSAGRIPLKPSGSSSSPKAASQMNLPGQQKNLEISKLLVSAASVPPVTLASGYPTSKANGFSFATATENILTSTPVQKVTEKSQPPKVLPMGKSEAPLAAPSLVGGAVPVTSSQKPPFSGVAPLSKSPMFTPSASKSLTSPTRVTPTASPTTKVFGAPIGDLGVENFKPLSSRLPSPTNVPDAASTGVCAVSVSRKSPPFTSPSIPTAAQTYATTTAYSTTNLDAASTPPVASTASNADAVKADSPPVATSTVSKPFAGGLFAPNSPDTSAAAELSFHEHSAVSTSTASTATTAAAVAAAAAKSTLFGLPPVTPTVTSTSTPVVTSVSVTSGPSTCLFGEPTVSVLGSIATTVTVTQPSRLLGSTVVTTAATSQPNQVFGNVVVATTTTGAAVSQPSQVLGTTVSTVAAVAASSESRHMSGTAFATSAATQPNLTLGTAVATTAAATQPGKLFGTTSVATVSTSQPNPVFGTTVTTTAPSTSPIQVFGSAVATTADSQPGRGFGQSSATASTQPVVALFGQPAAASASQSGGLFGQFASPASAQGGGLFGQPATPTSTQAGNVFGQSPAPATAQTGNLSAQSGQTGGGLFGSPVTTNGQSTGLFGQSPVPTSSQSGGLFGQSVCAKTGGLFGQPAAGPAAPTGGLFGHTATVTAPPTGGLFG